MKGFGTRIAAVLVVMILTVAISLGYNVGWTGFDAYSGPPGDAQRGKTLWDWLDLLVVPAALALGAYWLNRMGAQSDRLISRENQRNHLLLTYLERISALLLDKQLRGSEFGSEGRQVARALTLAVLRDLDGSRKGLLLTFLRDTQLIERVPVVDLTDADLSEALLSHANLNETNLYRANLRGADLRGAKLSAAVLASADLTGAKLGGATLEMCILWGATLKDADLTNARLNASNLIGADLTGAKLSGAVLTAANLAGAIRHGADFPATHAGAPMASP